MKDEIITDKIDQDIEKRIGSATYNVSKGLQIQHLSKRRIEKINKGSNQVRHARFFFLWVQR